MIMTAFSEILDATWTTSNIPKPQFHRGNMTNAESKSKLTGHNIKRNKLHSTTFNTFHILYIDDGSFIFQSRTDLINGLEIINNIFKAMGLEMHVGKGETKSKTEAMYFPTNAFFKQPALTTITESDDSNLLITNPAEDMHEHDGTKTYSKLTQNQ
jgi:hypothetical protein